MQIIDPTEYPGWDSLLLRNNDHSFFHSSAWAKVLKESYRYKPLYFVKIVQDRLMLLMPFMEIDSFVTGRRGVSLPFSDICAPFAQNEGLLQAAITDVIDFGNKAKWRYSEWRDVDFNLEFSSPTETYYTHNINLLRPEAALFSSLHESNRRNIRKAIKEGVSIRIDQSLDAIKSFYRLNCLTRKRHGLPPQPYFFFNCLFDHVLQKGFGFVVLAFHSNNIIAASVFFHFGTMSMYKYGASNMDFQHLRPNNLVMWEAIKWCRNAGFSSLNLGRTELDNQGLLKYKRLWGAIETPINYYRYDFMRKSFLENRPKRVDYFKSIFTRSPESLLRFLGRIFYKHMG